MYRLETDEGRLSKKEFVEISLERAAYHAGLLSNEDPIKWLVYENKEYTGTSMNSLIFIKDDRSAYSRKLHIVKHMYLFENNTLFEDDLVLSEEEIGYIKGMDNPAMKPILKSKPNCTIKKAHLKVIEGHK